MGGVSVMWSGQRRGKGDKKHLTMSRHPQIAVHHTFRGKNVGQGVEVMAGAELVPAVAILVAVAIVAWSKLCACSGDRSGEWHNIQRLESGVHKGRPFGSSW
jgi:hypothetical protein